ncbi:SWI5 [[Candida] subhashii]|uniref:SWI5 n=1 Tax=[Candida] subhashii TaxID=561895 RepID=A0A8J5UQ88_9ASCO|nr:SWI5 [[Candida] subhashii]KAG7664591.1 SWI5 [[Candida] subhashii]
MDRINIFEEINSKPIPLPHENFDEYFNNQNDIDFLFNETLSGLQDLDVPSGYLLKQDNNNNNNNYGKQNRHSRQQSGTAIFGFIEHNRGLSITGVAGDLYKASGGKSIDFGKSISPGELMTKSMTPSFQHHQAQGPSQEILDLNFEQKPILLLEEDEFEEENKITRNHLMPQSSPIRKETISTPPPTSLLKKGPKSLPRTAKQNEYLVTNASPKAYKFPPSPTSDRENRVPVINNYSAKYLQELYNQPPKNYVDDISPLLEQESTFENNKPQSAPGMGYVPIPVQEPVPPSQQRRPSAKQQSPFKPQAEIVNYPVQSAQPQFTQFYQDDSSARKLQLNKSNFNATYLPPPSPPSSDWQGSPEAPSPSPSRPVLFQQPPKPSPVHLSLRNEAVNFYTSQFFSDPPDNNNGYNTQYLSSSPQQQLRIPVQNVTYNLQSSPMYNNNLTSQLSSLNSSPDRFYSSPIRPPVPIPAPYEPVEDPNATLRAQPLLPSTPVKNNTNKMKIEWSPVISPESKNTLQKQIKDTSPRRRVKKTSLLPPGELDNYWIGPDENKVYTCTYKNCGKKFTRRYNVRSHIQTHLSDRPFGCMYCPKRFVRQHDLNRHVKGHLEARHCKCDCGKEFARLDALKKHQERNICVGGFGKTNNCVTKPKKRTMKVLDALMSDKLEEQLTSEQQQALSKREQTPSSAADEFLIYD